jgi:hypothetical protein
MLIQLAPGVRLRNPVTLRLVGPEPFTVGDHDYFWLRRLRDGDVVKVESAAAVPVPSPAAKPAASASTSVDGPKEAVQ